MNGNPITSPYGERAGTTRKPETAETQRRRHWRVIYLSYMFREREARVPCGKRDIFTAILDAVDVSARL